MFFFSYKNIFDVIILKKFFKILKHTNKTLKKNKIFGIFSQDIPKLFLNNYWFFFSELLLYSFHDLGPNQFYTKNYPNERGANQRNQQKYVRKNVNPSQIYSQVQFDFFLNI